MRSSDDHRVEEFQLLAHTRRKRLVVLLAILPASISTTTRLLAELITVFETGDNPRHIDAKAYSHINSSFAKSHLGPLEDGGVIVRDGPEIRPGPAFWRYALLAIIHESLTHLTLPTQVE